VTSLACSMTSSEETRGSEASSEAGLLVLLGSAKVRAGVAARAGVGEIGPRWLGGGAEIFRGTSY